MELEEDWIPAMGSGAWGDSHRARTEMSGRLRTGVRHSRPVEASLAPASRIGRDPNLHLRPRVSARTQGRRACVVIVCSTQAYCAPRESA